MVTAGGSHPRAEVAWIRLVPRRPERDGPDQFGAPEEQTPSEREDSPPPLPPPPSPPPGPGSPGGPRGADACAFWVGEVRFIEEGPEAHDRLEVTSQVRLREALVVPRPAGKEIYLQSEGTRFQVQEVQDLGPGGLCTGSGATTFTAPSPNDGVLVFNTGRAPQTVHGLTLPPGGAGYGINLGAPLDISLVCSGGTEMLASATGF